MLINNGDGNSNGINDNGDASNAVESHDRLND